MEKIKLKTYQLTLALSLISLALVGDAANLLI